MTQKEYDDIIIAIVGYQSRINERTVSLRRQNDPAAYQREEELMMLQNIVNALAYYDLNSNILCDVDIRYYYELATDIVHSCPF